MLNIHFNFCAQVMAAPFGRRLVLCLIGRFELAVFTPPGGRHQSPVLAIGGKYTVKTGEVDSWLWHQCGEAGDETQWLEDHMRGAILVRRLQW